ncbi:hypothetical protein HanIR_Chr05g0254841 [Helianthus annuus]|nr:hypothetical protein HanIR_Chr05g0254841 [Helianthus annuus]
MTHTPLAITSSRTTSSPNRYPFRFSKSPSSVSTLRRNQITMTSMSNSITGFSNALSAITGTKKEEGTSHLNSQTSQDRV